MKRPDPQALERARRILARAHVVPYAPTDAQIAARLMELDALGLPDVPEFLGISSPVRQYAINSLATAMAHAAGRDDEAPRAMITLHAGLLDRADVLAERFGLRPVAVDEALQALDP